MSTERPDEAAIAAQVVVAVFGLAARLRTAVTRELQDLDLTDALADALWALDPADGPLPRRELAQRLHCDPSNVTFLADRLAERGLLARVEDPADRRVRALALTDAGLTARDRLTETLRGCLHDAGLSEADQRSLLTLLAGGCRAGS